MKFSRALFLAGLSTLAALAAMPSPATSHGLTYAGNDDCGVTPPCVVPPCPTSSSVGGRICWPGGHVPTDAAGGAWVTIRDDVFDPVGGYVCQDLDTDLDCGDVGELSETFCLAQTFYMGTNGWNPNFPLYVFVGGLLTTNLECGTFANAGTTGIVLHS